jgi:hypothetical protein
MKGGKNQVSRRRFLKKAAVATPAVAAANVLGVQKSSAQTHDWDKEVDIVIIGTGFAGLSAAISAKDAGATVLILEKMPQKYEGGNSRVSGNMWWTPTNLPEALEYMEALCAGLTERECLWACFSRNIRNSPVRTACVPGATEALAEAGFGFQSENRLKREALKYCMKRRLRIWFYRRHAKSSESGQPVKENKSPLKPPKALSSPAEDLSSISKCRSNISRAGLPMEGELRATRAMESGWRRRPVRLSGI